MSRSVLQCLAITLAACLPLWSIIGQGDTFLADPLSELPVKLWGWHAFAMDSGRFLGGTIQEISFPNPGPLNNPDVVGTVLIGLLSPVVGEANAYNLMVCLLLSINGCAAWALARHLTQDTSAVVTGVTCALSPLALSYGMGGAITDLLNLWPYPLVLLLLLRGLRQPGAGLTNGWRFGVGAGVLLGLGLTTCVYNFVVFAPMAILAAAWLPWGWRAGLHPSDPCAAPAGLGPMIRRAAHLALQVGLGFALTGGTYALFLMGIMDAESSQMSTEMVGSVRHSPPFQELSLASEDRYVAYLVDYFSSGKDAAVLRDNASRFRWAFHPGWLVYALTLWGIWSHRSRLSTVILWPAMAVFFMLLSTGPFLIISDDLSLQGPDNHLWTGLFHFFPGTAMLLEPFRYGLVVTMALGVAAGIGAHALRQRWGPWVPAVLAIGVIVETVVVSPTPWPPPTTQMSTEAAYESLDDVAEAGPIIELPYFHYGTGLFHRRHFLHQRTHGRPIPNPVFGLAPPVLVDNPLTYALLHEEDVPDRFMPRTSAPSGSIESGAKALAAEGFTAIIVQPDGYPDRSTQMRVRRILRKIGHIKKHEGLWVIPLSGDASVTPASR